MHRLLLCMTEGVSLRAWERNGCLHRELQPYLEYVRRGWEVTIATYDNPTSIPALPPNVRVTVLRDVPRFQFANFFALRRAVARSDVVKTNQLLGSWWYVLAAKSAGRPVLVRCGWVPGLNLSIEDGLTWKVRIFRMLEGFACRWADQCQVATARDRGWISRHYGVTPGKVHVTPNWIDTGLFRPLDAVAEPHTVVSCGRLVTVKRLDLMIDACRLAGVRRLTLIGDGPERNRLESRAAQAGVAVEFAGTRPQVDLPSLLQKSQVFVLSSQVEGHPKALLEAMAAGLCCVGAKAPGVSDTIEHERTGLLTEADAASLAAGLRRALDDPTLRATLGGHARRYVQQHLSFDTIIDAEICRVTTMARNAIRMGAMAADV